MPTMTKEREYVNASGLAAIAGISPQRIKQILDDPKALKPIPDAYVNGRPVWLPETAERWKAEREARKKN